jgi:tRNA modification GTPase
LFDASRRFNKDDAMLVKKLKAKKVIAIINKIDLEQKINQDEIRKNFTTVIEISAKKLKNINRLEEAVANLIYQGKLIIPEPILVTNLRHIEALRHTQKLIAEALNSLDNKLSLEFIAQDLKDALGYLDDILGKRFCEDLLDKIFSEFCIGK